jgi:hypothetical protein
MNQVDRDTILNAATAVRHWTVAKAQQMKMDEDLCGMCAIASAELFKHLVHLGYKPEIHVWEGGWTAHCFVIVEDHVCDVTATQFGLHDVILEHVKEAEQWRHYASQHQFDSVESFVAWQKKVKWARHQQATV